MKDFDAWNIQKKQIDSVYTRARPRERDIWWVRVGMNVGGEIYGKGEMYLRPVLIINAEDDKTFVGIPLTSNIKTSKYSVIIRTTDNKLHSVLTSQIRVFDRKRLWRLKYVLIQSEYEAVKRVFDSLYKIQQISDNTIPHEHVLAGYEMPFYFTRLREPIPLHILLYLGQKYCQIIQNHIQTHP